MYTDCFLQLDIQIPDPGIEDPDESDFESERSGNNSEGLDEERQRMKLHLEGMNTLDRPPALMVNGQFT
jgi:hypothetical protein